MRIKVHWARYNPYDDEIVALLHVYHLWGDHFETWRGSPRLWTSDHQMPLTSKRRRKLKKAYLKKKAEWPRRRE